MDSCNESPGELCEMSGGEVVGEGTEIINKDLEEGSGEGICVQLGQDVLFFENFVFKTMLGERVGGMKEVMCHITCSFGGGTEEWGDLHHPIWSKLGTMISMSSR